MPKYNEFYYQNGYYGIRAALAYSAEPITATALDYRTIMVEWLTPTGAYSDFRLVRSQLGFPQTQEDGAVVYSSIGAPSSNSILDSSDDPVSPLIYGKFVFYRAWVRKSESSYWTPAGDTFTLLPSPHSLGVGRDAVYSGAAADGYSTDDVLVYSDTRVDPFVSTTHERFLSMLPRAITTSTNSGTDVVQGTYDKFGEPTGSKDNSLISTFLSAFSFTLDEFITFASLITPDVAVHWASPTAVYLGSHELGLTLDIEAVTITQRRLLRNAIEIYSEKGTLPGLELLIQSMTAYDATLTTTKNLMLTVADATFNFINWESGALGNWSSLSNSLSLTRVSNQQVLNSAAVPGTLDEVYCAKILSSVAGKGIALGTSSPETTAIPVTAGEAYSYSFYAKEGESGESEPAGSDNVSVELRWYDRFGQPISSTISTVTVEGTSWTRYQVENKVAPAKAVYLGIVMFFNQLYPVYIDMVQVEQSATVTAYQEPRGVNILLNPPKVNYIKNPNFQINATYWQGTELSLLSGVTSQVETRSGPSAYKAISTGNGPMRLSYAEYIPVTALEYYSGSISVKDLTTSLNYEAGIEFYTGDTHTLVSTVLNGSVVPSTTEWTLATVSGKAPADATAARFFIRSALSAPVTSVQVSAGTATVTVPGHTLTETGGLIHTSSFTDGLKLLNGTHVVTGITPTTISFDVTFPNTPLTTLSPTASVSFEATPLENSTVYFDAAQFENTVVASDYFDGYLTEDGGEWMGAASDSYSVNYPAKFVRLARLESEIQQYLGFDTPYYISTVEGQRTSGLS